MKTIVTILRDCAQDLREVRARLPNNLEPGVIVLFDNVVERLEQCDVMANDRAALLALINDGLLLASRLGEAAWVIAEVIRRHHG